MIDEVRPQCGCFVQLDLLMSTNVSFDTRQVGLSFLFVMQFEYCFCILNNPHLICWVICPDSILVLREIIQAMTLGVFM